MIEKTAYYLNDATDRANIELAHLLCESSDTDGLAEIVHGLYSQEAALAGDCIKVLYEAAALKPELLAGYASNFIELLESKNNRLVWGAMMALAQIAELNPDEIYKNIAVVKRVFENGSVITRDNAISVFAGLCRANPEYKNELFPIIIHHLKNCRPKEIPQHAKRALVCVDHISMHEFESAIISRYGELSEPQKKRINALLRALLQNQKA